MLKEEIKRIHDRVRFVVKVGENTVETHQDFDGFRIVQKKDYTIKKYTFVVKTIDNTFVSIRIKNGTKWVKIEGNTFDFNIDKPFSEIEVSFAVSSITPMRSKIKIDYANKEAWDREVEECRIKRLNSELQFGVYSGNDFAWFLTKKPKWLDHFVIKIKLYDYEFSKISSDKNNHVYVDKLPNGQYIAVCEAFDNNGLVISCQKEFAIKSRSNDPEHRVACTFGR